MKTTATSRALALCAFAVLAAGLSARAATVTLAPAAGTATNVLQVFTGDTALEIAGPGAVSLNPANAHTGGTTLSGGTLVIDDAGGIDARSPVGAGALTIEGGTLSGSGTLSHDIAATAAATLAGDGTLTLTGDNTFSDTLTISDGTVEIADGATTVSSGVAIASGASLLATGGTLSIAAATGAGTLAVSGSAVANSAAPTTANNYFAWIANPISVGANGATFKDGATTTKYAQLSGVVSGTGGVTFDGGNWGYYAANTYSGATILQNGASLFLGGAGYIPSGSAVTVGAGCSLRNGNTEKTLSSLTLGEDATLGFANTLGAFVVSGSLSLPSRAKIALYSSNNPATDAKTTNGSYAVLKVPAAYADALNAVVWTCPTAATNRKVTFTVSTSSGTATLTMTIATDAGTSDFTVAAGSGAAFNKDFAVSSDITVNGTLAVTNLYGSSTGGSVTVNDGGVLSVSGNIRPVNASGNSFDLYLNEGGSLVFRTVEGTSGLAKEANATPRFHFDGGTVHPVSFEPASDGVRYLLNYQAGLVGAGGLVIDLSRWTRPDGYAPWVRSSVQGQVNHDPDLGGTSDGGIVVRNAGGDARALVFFGSRFAGSSLTGGITVENGAGVSSHASALAGQTLTVLPGGLFKAYNGTTSPSVADVTLGAAGASASVRLQAPSGAPALVVSGNFDVLSPVAFSTTGNWNDDASMAIGVYTALVYSASTTLDTSLFSSADPAYTLTATEENLVDGNYAGMKALVVAISETTYGDMELKEGATRTISGNETYGDIYIGDFETSGGATLVVTGGDLAASGTLHLAYKPYDDAKHVDSFVQNGGTVSVEAIRSMYRGSNSQSGRADAEIEINGGSLAVSGNVQLGFNRTRAGYYTLFTVNDGATVDIGGDMLLTRYSGTETAPQGILAMNGGALSVAGTIDLSACTNSSAYALDGGVFLRGGVLSAANIVQSVDYTPVQRLVFDGGTYAPSAAGTMQGLTKAHVSTNGAVVSTALLPAGATYMIAQDLLADPALGGATDGGLTKRGAGTLALSGANTFTGPVTVEAGTLAVTGAAALSDSLSVANGAVLDASGLSLTLATVAASGVVAADSLTVSGTGKIALVDEDSILSVDGDLALARGAAIDFSGLAEVPSGSVPVATASGTITVPDLVRARGAGDLTRCNAFVADGVLYAKPTNAAFVLVVK